jgi:hypothetical protein
MASVRRSSRVAQRHAHGRYYIEHQRNPPGVITAVLTRTTVDPSVPPQDGTCHFMNLPPELRLMVTELFFEDIFTRLTSGLGSPRGHIYRQDVSADELLTLLHVNHALRVETIKLCVRLAEDAFETVERTPPGPFQSSLMKDRGQLRWRIRDILVFLRQIRRSIAVA